MTQFNIHLEALTLENMLVNIVLQLGQWQVFTKSVRIRLLAWKIPCIIFWSDSLIKPSQWKT